LPQPGIAEIILQNVIGPSANSVEAEARLFILSLSAESHRSDPSIFRWIISFVIPENPPFLVATALFALQHLKIENQQRNQLSIELLVHSSFPVVQLFSVLLFQRTFDESFAVSQPLSILLTTLIQLANSVKDPKPGEMIDLLFRHFPQEFVPSADTLVLTFLQTWMSVALSDDQLGGIDFLHCVRGLIDILPLDLDVLSHITIPITEMCCEAILEHPESRSEVQLLEILTSLVKQQSNPPIVLFESLGPFQQYFSGSFPIASSLAADFARFFLALSSTPAFLQLSDGRYLAQLVAICDVCISHADYPDSAAIALILLTHVVQIGGTPVISLVDRAIFLLSNPSLPPPVFVSSFMLLASGLLTDSGRVLPSITAEAFTLLISKSSTFGTAPLNYATLAFSGLCVLARGGSVDAFMAAAKLVPAIIEKRIGEQIAEGEDESGFAEVAGSNCREKEMVIFCVELPSDSFNYVAAFRELLTVTEWAEMLPPELTNLIASGEFHS
jgi:hypothetical protein